MSARGYLTFYLTLPTLFVITCDASSQQNPRKVNTSKHRERCPANLGAGCRTLAGLGGDRFRLGITAPNRKAPNSAAPVLNFLLNFAARIVGKSVDFVAATFNRQPVGPWYARP